MNEFVTAADTRSARPIAANDNWTPAMYRTVLEAWRAANPDTDSTILPRAPRNVSARLADDLLDALRAYVGLHGSDELLQSPAGRIADAKVAPPEDGLGNDLSADRLTELAQDRVEFETRIVRDGPPLSTCGYCCAHYTRELKVPSDGENVERFTDDDLKRMAADILRHRKRHANIPPGVKNPVERLGLLRFASNGALTHYGVCKKGVIKWRDVTDEMTNQRGHGLTDTGHPNCGTMASRTDSTLEAQSGRTLLVNGRQTPFDIIERRETLADVHASLSPHARRVLNLLRGVDRQPAQNFEEVGMALGAGSERAAKRRGKAAVEDTAAELREIFQSLAA